MKLFQLLDFEDELECGIVHVTNVDECTEKDIDPYTELNESWGEYNKLQEHEFDHQDVNEFVLWNNENRVTQIERVYVENIIPDENF
jgi:hypothetical protein